MKKLFLIVLIFVPVKLFGSDLQELQELQGLQEGQKLDAAIKIANMENFTKNAKNKLLEHENNIPALAQLAANASGTIPLLAIKSMPNTIVGTIAEGISRSYSHRVASTISHVHDSFMETVTGPIEWPKSQKKLTPAQERELAAENVRSNQQQQAINITLQQLALASESHTELMAKYNEQQQKCTVLMTAITAAREQLSQTQDEATKKTIEARIKYFNDAKLRSEQRLEAILIRDIRKTEIAAQSLAKLEQAG